MEHPNVSHYQQKKGSAQQTSTNQSFFRIRFVARTETQGHSIGPPNRSSFVPFKSFQRDLAPQSLTPGQRLGFNDVGSLSITKKMDWWTSLFSISYWRCIWGFTRRAWPLFMCQYPFQSMSPWVHERRLDQTRQNLSPTGSIGCKSFVSPEVDPELAVEVKVTMAGFTYFGMVGMPIISRHVELLKILDIVDSLYWCDYIVSIWLKWYWIQTYNICWCCLLYDDVYVRWCIEDII